MSNPLQPLDPQGAPPPVTPAASPSDAAGYASVAVQPMDIQAPMEDLSGLSAAAGALMGADVLYAHGPRQAEASALLDSPQGTGAHDITAGWTGGWPVNPSPPDAAYNEYTPGNTPGSPTGVDQGTG